MRPSFVPFSYNKYDHRRGLMERKKSIAEDFIGAQCKDLLRT